MTYRWMKPIAGSLCLLGSIGFGATAQAQEGASCGCMDVVFVIDDTGSMGGAIDNIKADATDIIDDIIAASDNDQQLGVVTFKDNVDIDQQLQDDPGGAVTLITIAGIVHDGGSGGPEASDEALNTVINELVARTGQPVDFTGSFRPTCVKIAIMVTDNLPGGFDDTYTVGVDDVNADQVAQDAAARGILISALHVGEASTPNATERAIMENYATVTGGVYTPLLSNGGGSSDAIKAIIESCGSKEIIVPFDVKPQSCRNPLTLKKKGVLPVAILGYEGLDVATIDPSTVMLTSADLTSAPPLRWNTEDVATPFQPLTGKTDPYDCTDEGADGFTDLTLKFDTVSLIEDLGLGNLDETIVLGVKGQTFEGTQIRGEDVVVVIKKR